MQGKPTAIAALIEIGKVKIKVSKVYSIENVADTHRDMEAKRIQGKVALEIRKEHSL